MDEQLRITLWPGGLLKAPKVQRADVISVQGDWIKAKMPGTYEPLGEEVVIRDLLEVDADDIDALAGFMGSHGVFARKPMTAGLAYELKKSLDSKRPPGVTIHLGEAGVYVRTLQAMALHWLAVGDDVPVMRAWEEAGLAHADRKISRRDVEDDMAWAWFASGMNAGLHEFPPHVVIVPATKSTRDLLSEYGEPTVDLFTGLTVQLFNLMADDLPVLHCANETCGRRFVRQSGRAVKGLHRTEGVKFCSSTCAKAQVQREYRRRKRSSR